MSSQRSEGSLSEPGESTPDLATIETTTSPLTFPEDFENGESWQRAQTEADQGGWINNAERMVWLDESDEPHRVTFVLVGEVLRVDCDCASHHYRAWGPHVAKCWWEWVTGGLSVTHLQTGREYQTPPEWLQVATWGEPKQYDGLTPKELDAYLACELGECGVREYARKTGRAPGTVGNQLRWAREKVGGEQA